MYELRSGNLVFLFLAGWYSCSMAEVNIYCLVVLLHLFLVPDAEYIPPYKALNEVKLTFNYKVRVLAHA